MAKKRNSKFTKDGFERISIWQTKVGDLICYLSSQKVYLITEKEEKFVTLVSATQQFKISNSFDVKRVLKSEEFNEGNYDALMKRLPTTDKNVPFKDLLLIAEEYKHNGSVSNETLNKINPITVEETATKKKEEVFYKYLLPEGWNKDNWFDKIQIKEFRTEKEVETKFILPLLFHLGYTEDDRYDAMPTSIPNGSRRISMEIDFAMFASETEDLEEIPILLVEAKKENRLSKQVEIQNGQLQLKSYAIGTGCRFGLLTDSKTVQVLDLMPNLGNFKILFECQRSELKEQFLELYNLIGKDRLKDYYLELS